MKIALAVHGLEFASGVSVCCVETAEALVAMGHDVQILYERHFERKPSAAVKVVQGSSLNDLASCPDVVHVHGVWSVFSVRAMAWCWRHGVPYVVSLHGGLLPRVFTKGWLKKTVFYKLLLRRFLNRANRLHCTAEPEAVVAKHLGLASPRTIVPLGVHVPENGFRVEGVKGKTVLYVGRLSEEKGLLDLVRAWAGLGASDWRLVLAGPDWRGYRARIEKMVATQKAVNVEFAGLVQGEQLQRLYRLADIFVLPSPMENFSAVVLDALAYGVPVVATKGTPWQELRTERCGWWVDAGTISLQSALSAAMALTDAERREMGARGRHLAMSKYAWSCIAKQYEEIYISCAPSENPNNAKQA